MIIHLCLKRLNGNNTAGVINRLLGGLCYAVEPLNEEDRIRELARQAALRGILLTPDIGQWISAHLPRDMRSLTRVMDVANQIALHAQRKVTLQVIREAARAAGMAEDESIAHTTSVMVPFSMSASAMVSGMRSLLLSTWAHGAYKAP